MKRSNEAFCILLLLGALLVAITGCDNTVEVDTPPVDPTGFLAETTPLPSASRAVMEGVYQVVDGKDLLGERVVIRWTRDRLSIFTGVNGGYLVMDGGSLDSVLFFLGYWRYATGSETGTANFYISSDQGGSAILAGDTSFSAITMTGSYGEGTGSAGKRFTLRYERPFSPAVKAGNFRVMAHRGGGRNSDYLGVSENTVEMIGIAERFGATGIEIDLRLSKDGVPFLYHDNDVNLRLTRKGPIWGNIEDFTWAQLRTLITLRNGERIPSAREALEYVLLHTNIRTVWLDTKDVDVLPPEIALQQEILGRADSMGRELEIFIGLPSQDVYDAFVATAGHDTLLSLCELEPELARAANSRAWAPRWTQGTQDAEVAAMHSEGRLAFVWTLDEAAYIEEFVDNGEFDGILTNYPTIVSYYHYIR